MFVVVLISQCLTTCETAIFLSTDSKTMVRVEMDSFGRGVY
jgi:hypothetical protein